MDGNHPSVFFTRSAGKGTVLKLSLVSDQKSASGFLKGWVARPNRTALYDILHANAESSLLQKNRIMRVIDHEYYIQQPKCY